MSDALLGGFEQAPLQSSNAFRAALAVLSQPGEIRELQGALPPAPLSVAAGVLLLTLCDGTTPVHLAGGHDCAAVRDWITFHCGAPLVGAEAATFAFGDWTALHPLGRFAIGQPDYPDRAATLIVEMATLTATGAALRGPGIAEVAHLSLPEIAAFQANRALFPLGFDCFFTCGVWVAALPRSTRVEAV
ncbi:carbon-phosphorus lyase complex subunit [Cypionkella aquatica]|uniref:Carbon-phosphorus lyase complex subunit n=1 Tax=Cypionkella aquatica TaxID=1756042 RepID=A0AA37X0F2_9RHOB|nr:phosphonate C-P lyase system protein PhnH [Cypionkella aquatica]GLS86614.1 carbon-phosphorus lyase complex subunit [Cypionkella aquatica]